MMCRTSTPRRQVRAIPVRGVWPVQSLRWFRAPFAAFLLSFVVFASPELTLAPLAAGEPFRPPSRPVEQASLTFVPHVAHALEIDRRAAGMAVPSATTVMDAPQYQDALDAARTVASAYGITFAAVRDGQLVWTGSSGVTRDGQTKLAPDSQLVIGSVTKTYVAATILQLVDEGRLELGDSVRRHLPSMRSVSREITIRQLLDHTSGLADLYNETTRKALEEQPQRAWSADEVFGSLHAPWYAPGQGWAYANTNYYLLGLIVERVTGSSLADELDRRFLDPLGLEATQMLTGADTAGPLPPAWATIFWASGAMSASAADLARWGDSLYTDGLLQTQTREAMLKLNDHDYGLGVQRIEMPEVTGYGHTGLLNTYTTLLLHIPKDDLTMAMLVNRSEVDLGGMLLARAADGGPSLFELATGRKVRTEPAESAQASP